MAFIFLCAEQRPFFPGPGEAPAHFRKLLIKYDHFVGNSERCKLAQNYLSFSSFPLPPVIRLPLFSPSLSLSPIPILSQFLPVFHRRTGIRLRLKSQAVLILAQQKNPVKSQPRSGFLKLFTGQRLVKPFRKSRNFLVGNCAHFPGRDTSPGADVDFFTAVPSFSPAVNTHFQGIAVPDGFGRDPAAEVAQSQPPGKERRNKRQIPAKVSVSSLINYVRQIS